MRKTPLEKKGFGKDDSEAFAFSRHGFIRPASIFPPSASQRKVTTASTKNRTANANRIRIGRTIPDASPSSEGRNASTKREKGKNRLSSCNQRGDPSSESTV